MSVQKRSTALPVIASVDSEALAIVVCRMFLNSNLLGSADLGATRFKCRLGETVLKIVEYQIFKEAEPEMARVAEMRITNAKSDKQADAISRQLDKAEEYREAVADINAPDGDDTLNDKIGAVLAELFYQSTGLYEETLKRAKDDKHSSYVIAPTPKLMAALLEGYDTDYLSEPFRFPMVIPPKPWSDMYTGGFLDQRAHPLRLVKAPTAVCATISQYDMAQVYSAVNAIQAVPRRINQRVLAAAEMLHRELADSEPPKYGENATPVEKAKYYQSWQEWVAEYRLSDRQLKTARKFRNHEAIYMPHNFDFRGRMYDCVDGGGISPQSNKQGKALIDFARVKKLGERGANHLARHAANCYGVDKVSHDAREDWTIEHSEDLLKCARAPALFPFWRNADDPLGFLAACFEWEGFLQDGEDHVSHLPIAIDGTCNGLQHFAAMLRDVPTAKAVNVMQVGDAPSDIYGVVAEAMKLTVPEALKPLMTRKIPKRSVMTLPYGATANTMRADMLTELAAAGAELDADSGTVVGESLEGALGEHVAAAKGAMGWLKKVAKAFNADGNKVQFVSPLGFPVIQNKMTLGKTNLEITILGKRARIGLTKPTDQTDKRKQTSGIAPNFVHMRDAAHLQATTNAMVRLGVRDFSMVHDSYAVHACDTDELHMATRSEFANMYTGDVLGELLVSLKSALSEEAYSKLPEPPKMGTLDVTAVLESEYFFS